MGGCAVDRVTSSGYSNSMAVFTIELHVGSKFFTDNAGQDFHAAEYAIRMGAREACRMASLLDDDSPPRIIVRAYGFKPAEAGAALVEFTATDMDEIDSASTLITKRLGSAVALRAILRVPQAQSQGLLADDAQ